MNNKWKIIKTLFLKEVCDVLRDKKAIMMMVFVPVIIYPLIMVVSMAIASMVDGNNDRVYDIVVYNESSRFDAENLENVLKENAVEKNEEDGSEEQLYSINYEISDKKISEEENIQSRELRKIWFRKNKKKVKFEEKSYSYDELLNLKLLYFLSLIFHALF